MPTDTRTIVDFAAEDNAKEMRDTFYAALQQKVMAHLENQKMEVAQRMFEPTQGATVQDVAV